MFKRLFFLLGLLLGAFAAFRLRSAKSCLQPAAPTDFRDYLTDAFLLCDSAGTVAEANAPAQALFGSHRSLPALRYLTGQLVPPGRHPLRQALVSHEAASGLYGCTAADGSERILKVSARPLPDGGAAAVFRDVTAQHESEERERAAQARQAAVQTLCRRLRQAQTAEAAAQAVTEETRALLGGWPDVQVKLFVFHPASDTLTCLASAPDDRPKRPRSASQAWPQTIRFDAQVPELWQLYVAREPSANALPLISGGVAFGHLSVTSTADMFKDQAVRETWELIASLAALALAGTAASGQAASDAAQVAAVREIAAAVSTTGAQALADTVTECVKRVIHAEVCTLSVPTTGEKLSVMGKAYKDDLLLPDTAPGDPRLQSKTSRKAWRAQKIVMHLGLPPTAEPWRAFAGTGGLHSVMALPLTERRGVLAVYTQGDKPLPDAQRKFLETVAALVSLNPPAATAREGGAD